MRRRARVWHYWHMDHFAGTTDLRNFSSLASRLRQLAKESPCHDDQALYLLTAKALDQRAEWLATSLPQKYSEYRDDAEQHKPVDVTI